MAEPRTINDPSDNSGARVIGGALQVTITSGNITASNPSVAPTGGADPGNATFIGYGNGTGILTGVTTANPLPVSFTASGNTTVIGPTAVGSAAATPPVLGLAGTANATATGLVQIAKVDSGGNVSVAVQSMPANITANVTGPVAGNSTVGGQPVQVGWRAISAETVPNGNNTVVQPVTDLVGKPINQPYSNKENMLRGNCTVANTTAVAVIGLGAQGAAFKIYITSVQAFRTDAGTTLVYVTINDTGNTTVPLPPNGGAAVNYPVPLALAANTTANITLSANVTSVLVSMQGYFGT